MRTTLLVVGIVLIIVGLFSLGYQGISYTTQQKVAEVKIGDAAHFQVTEQKEKTIPIPPLLGGASLLAGIILVIVARLKNK